jgi:hypothetical protein
MNNHIKKYICINVCYIENKNGIKKYDYEEMIEDFDTKFIELQEKEGVDICNRCKNEINENDEIHYPNDKSVCGYCIESKECDKLYNN